MTILGVRWGVRIVTDDDEEWDDLLLAPLERWSGSSLTSNH
jgi:hypothetical protein